MAKNRMPSVRAFENASPTAFEKAGAFGGGGGVDTELPVFTGIQEYSYIENQVADAIVAPISGADDNVGVTQYRFVSATGDVFGTTSADGYFTIDAQGAIRITSAGVAAGVNDFDDGTNANVYYIQAGDAADNWSLTTQITLNETNDTTDDAPKYAGTVQLAIDNSGWFDAFLLAYGGNADLDKDELVDLITIKLSGVDFATSIGAIGLDAELNGQTGIGRIIGNDLIQIATDDGMWDGVTQADLSGYITVAGVTYNFDAVFP